jgi:hypothetical protein
MSYIARTQQARLATAHNWSANLTLFTSTPVVLSSSHTHARHRGHALARKHSPHAPKPHHPAHHRLNLPPGIEEQPF